MGTFDYLIDRIKNAEFQDEPYRHLHISNFLKKEHFDSIVSDGQITIPKCRDASQLIDTIQASGYSIIQFPGCVTKKEDYLSWLNGNSKRHVHEATEGFGMVFRLENYRNPLLKELDDFFHSKAYSDAITSKFGIEGDLTLDTGLQKYLHGYEISPHPDIRRKALTWMLNINPGEAPEQHDYHTHYMRLKPEWSFISEFWKNNGSYDRDWLPWEWCETVKRQKDNNSIVFFSPANDTMHAVKAYYDHLASQRTQYYGNLWYPKQTLKKVKYKYFDVASAMAQDQIKVDGSLKGRLQRGPVGAVIKNMRALKNKGFRNIRNID